MKTTKYILVSSAIALMALGTLPSCDSKSSHKLSDTTEAFLKKMPAAATPTIETIGVNIDTMLVNKWGEYSVLLKSGVKVYFDEDGEWYKVSLHKHEMTDGIRKLLQQATLNYLKANYADKAIKRIERSSRGRYKVTLLDDDQEVLHFTRTGKFAPNDVKRLPSQVNVTLKKYFADDAVESATIDASYEYSVELKSGIYLEFDRLGHFERIDMPKGESVPEDFLTSMPSLMVKYLNTKYPGRTMRRIVRKDFGYYVKLSKTEADKDDAVELCFSKAGDYLRNANKDEDEEEDL